LIQDSALIGSDEMLSGLKDRSIVNMNPPKFVETCKVELSSIQIKIPIIIEN
jgi:hypothetical protein